MDNSVRNQSQGASAIPGEVQSFSTFESFIEASRQSLLRAKDIAPTNALWAVDYFYPGKGYRVLDDSQKQLTTEAPDVAEFLQFKKSRIHIIIAVDHCLLTLSWSYDIGTIYFVRLASNEAPSEDVEIDRK